MRWDLTNRYRHSRHGALLLCLLLLTPCAVLHGQAQNDPQAAVDATTENRSGVYPRDSAIAMDRLALARRMEQLKEWGKSADLYQEILQKYPDRVVPVARNADEQMQYASVTEAVRQALCKWPADGLDAYRARYEATAAGLVSSAGPQDPAKLHEVLSIYFPTDSAKTAGIRLMDTYFELGDYPAVVQIGRRLLEWHPNLTAERPMVLYRTALAAKLTGDSTVASGRLSELQNKFPQASGNIRGSDVVLADSLKQELDRDNSAVRAGTSDSWLTYGGNQSRDKISTSTVKPGARLYSIKLAEVTWKWVGDPAKRLQLEQQDNAQRNLGAGLGVMPVVDRGELFFQDNINIHAVDLDSGLPLPGWAQTYPGEGHCYKIAGGGLAIPVWQQFCLTITDKYVTGILNLSDNVSSAGVGAVYSNEPQLVCLDRHSGKELWTTSMRRMKDSESTLRTLKISGAPLIVGNNIYVVGYDYKGQQFEDCYLLCFDVNTGAYRWHSEIVSASIAPAVFNAAMQPVISSPLSHVAYAGGRLYVVTSLGAAAALDAYSGAVLWLDIFRKDEPPMVMGGRRVFMGGFGGGRGGIIIMNGGAITGMPTSSPAWVHNPAIVQNGKVFVFPEDSDCIYIYDADNGKEIKRIYVTDFAQDGPSKPDTLLGVNGDALYLAGGGVNELDHDHVWRIPWQAYDHSKGTDQGPPGYWASAECSSLIRGRSFVTADAVYVPEKNALQRVVLASGRVDSPDGTFPRNKWDLANEGPGNVVVTHDHVIIAGDKFVAVYTNLDLAKQKLNQEVADAPQEPAPRLHYAEVMFAAGQNEIAEDKLNEAFGLLGGAANLRPGAMRDRAFNDALGFTARIGLDPGSPEEARVIRLFDMAAAAAQSAPQQVGYRIARAKFDRDHKDFAGAVELYQQILADDAMRLVSLADPENGNASQARIVAQEAINRIIKDEAGGKEAYAKFDDAAAADFARAREANDADKLLQVVRVYPNSRVARQAMLGAASAYEAKGNPRQAALVLRQILNIYRDQDRSLVEEGLARNYLLMKNVDVAASRLALAAAASPDAQLHQPLTLPDGTILKDISLAAAQKTLDHLSLQIHAQPPPDLHLPLRGTRPPEFLPESPGSVIANVDVLVTPLEKFMRYDRLVTWTRGAGLSVYPAGKNTALCTAPQVNHFVRGVAWLPGGLLAWAGTSAYLIDSQSGQNHWQLDISSLSKLDAIADSSPPPAPAPAPRPVAPPQPQQIQGRIFIRGGGRLIISPPNARVDPDIQAGAPAPAVPNANDDLAGSTAELILQAAPIADRVVIATSTGRILAVDIADGHVIWQTRVSDHSVDRLLVNDDFTVIRLQDAQSVQFIVINSDSGELIGRQTFTTESGGYPVNLALAPEGSLVYTMADRICLLDLFDVDLTEHGMDPKCFSELKPDTAQMFVNASLPDQLIVHAGRVFAVSDWGKNVRIYPLQARAPWRPWQYLPVGAQQDVDAVLTTGSTDSANVTLHISGDYLYAVGPRSLKPYHIEHPDISWPSPDISKKTFDRLLFGKDYLTAVVRQLPALAVSNKTTGRVELWSFSRKTFQKDKLDRESGALGFNTAVNDIASDTNWQVMEGGIAYCNKGTVHLLMGARDTAAAAPATEPSAAPPPGQ